jgi:CubicO group peptidase (beta-lactamase class C family)
MKKLLLALALVTGCSHSLQPQKLAAVDDVLPGDDAKKLATALADVEALARDYADHHHLTALAVGVVYRDQLLWWRGLGAQAPTLDTVFSIGSVTKLFAGLALLELRDRGTLSLDDPVERWLPEIAGVVYPTSDSPRITLRHLVTHTSGLPRVGRIDYTSPGHELTERELLGALHGQTLEFAPGSRDSYSNLAMALVGPVVTRVTGVDFHAWMRDTLFKALGLGSAAWTRAEIPADRRAPAPGPEWHLGAGASMGGLHLSLRDLARFASFELDAWPPRTAPDNGPIRRATVRESQQPGLAVNWLVTEQPGLGHVISHTGAVADESSTIRLLPRRGIGVVALQAANPDDNDYEGLSKLGAVILRKLADAAPEPGPTLGAPAAAALDRVAKLLESADPAAAKDAFDPTFLSHISLEQVLQVLTQTHADVGSCSDPVIESAPTPTQATVALHCEKSNLRLQLATSPDPPYRLLGLQIRPLQ